MRGDPCYTPTRQGDGDQVVFGSLGFVGPTSCPVCSTYSSSCTVKNTINVLMFAVGAEEDGLFWTS